MKWTIYLYIGGILYMSLTQPSYGQAKLTAEQQALLLNATYSIEPKD